METTNAPVMPLEVNPKKRFNKTIIIALSLALITTGGYFAYDKSNSTKTIDQQKVQIAKVTTEKSELQSIFDASLVRIDSMQTVTTSLNVQLEEKNTEIAKSKVEIRNILNKKNISVAELAKAKSLIQGLNTKIGDMETAIAKLNEDNKVLGDKNLVLTFEKDNLTQELSATNVIKKELENKVDVASTLNASNITITPLDIRKNGKEKVSTSAKRVDKMIVKFDLANRIIKSGSTDLYVLVTGPDGKAISSGENFSGKFSTREEGDKFFTAKFPVALETAKTKNVAFSFIPESSFIQGEYKIEIYQNGFLIGQAVSSLKKGGLFS